MINQHSRILIMNSMGRSGTTLLQNMLCTDHGLNNLQEAVTYDHTRPDTLRQLAETVGWVCKFFVEVDTVSASDHYQEIEIIKPDLIYNTYRNDTFDQFLSFQISVMNNLWNGGRRLEYVPRIMPDPQAQVKYFIDSLALYKSLLQDIRFKYSVIDISYEDLIVSRAAIVNDYGLVKQNTLDQKLALIVNIKEVLEAWESANAHSN